MFTSRWLFGRSQGANCSSRPAAGARATLPHKLTHKPSVRNRGRVVAGGGSWLDGANFPETPLSVSKIVFGPERYFGARKGSPPPHARSAKPLWKPPSACPWTVLRDTSLVATPSSLVQKAESTRSPICGYGAELTTCTRHELTSARSTCELQPSEPERARAVRPRAATIRPRRRSRVALSVRAAALNDALFAR